MTGLLAMPMPMPILSEAGYSPSAVTRQADRHRIIHGASDQACACAATRG